MGESFANGTRLLHLSHVAKFKEREVTAEIAFSPVPSRRLGRSLGINNIPPKHCSYGYRYCQVGPTHDKLIVPRPFYTPEAIASANRP